MDLERILFVEDNRDNLQLVAAVLSGAGYEVIPATDAKEALAMLTQYGPSLVIVDLELPGMSGLELTRRIKTDPATRHVVVLGFSARAVSGDEERALEAGCDGFVAKPVPIRTLLGTIARHLRVPETGGTASASRARTSPHTPRLRRR